MCTGGWRLRRAASYACFPGGAGARIPTPMEHPHFAAVDIGSNAVRLLIKRLEDPETGRFGKVVLLRVPLRLGQDVFTCGFVTDLKLKHLVELMRAYQLVLGIYEVPASNCRFCATSAIREAANSSQVVESIRAATGFDVEVITGQDEAAIVCNLRSPSDRRKLVYVDVGGGSTEVSVMCGDETFIRKSFPVGTVRIINNAVGEEWRSGIKEALLSIEGAYPLGRHYFDDAVMVGAGGNINKLFSMAQERDMADSSMSVATLRGLYDELRPLSVEQRMVCYKLKADRADVIVSAADIFLTIADALGVRSIEIPSYGLADGIIADLWRRKRKTLASE